MEKVWAGRGGDACSGGDAAGRGVLLPSTSVLPPKGIGARRVEVGGACARLALVARGEAVRRGWRMEDAAT